MNYADHYSSASSYRKIFGDSPRFSASPLRLSGGSTRCSTSSSGFRSLASSRNSASSSGYYRGSFRPLSFSPVPSDSLDLAQTSVLNNEVKLTRTNEKEQLQGLNDRFAVFIDKVRNLEQQNKVLESELVTLRQKQQEPSRIAELYQQEMRDLRCQVEEASGEKNHMLMERDSIEDELQKLRVRYEDEVRAREDAEQTLRSFKKDVDDATVARLDLERKVESLLDEIAFLKKVHDEEIHELSGMVQVSRMSVEVELSKPDLTSALKEIRHSYESIATKNMQSAEEWYKSKFASLNEQATRNNESLRAGREEINEFRRQLQSKTVEIETLKGTNESLERQIREMEDTQNAEVAAMQDTIVHLDNELRNSKGEMAQHLREYQDLLNVKMALDIEITAYRKLLEGEETHFSTGMSYGAANHSVNYSYLPLPSAGSAPPSPSSSRKSRKKEAARKESLKETAEVKVEKNEEADLNSNS